MWYREPFFQVALPIIVTFGMAYWHNNKRFDDLGKRIDDLASSINKRIDDLRSEMRTGFDGINKRIDELTKRVDRLEDGKKLVH